MGDLLSFLRTKKSRRASPAPQGPAPEPPQFASPSRNAAAPSPSAEIVRLEDRRIPAFLPWPPPLPPYIGALLLDAAISAAAAATLAADLSTLPARLVAAAFEPWSA